MVQKETPRPGLPHGRKMGKNSQNHILQNSGKQPKVYDQGNTEIGGKWLTCGRSPLWHFWPVVTLPPPDLGGCLEGGSSPSKWPPLPVWVSGSGGDSADFVSEVFCFDMPGAPLRGHAKDSPLFHLDQGSLGMNHHYVKVVLKIMQKRRNKLLPLGTKDNLLGQTIDMLKAWEEKLESDILWRIKAMKFSCIYRRSKVYIHTQKVWKHLLKKPKKYLSINLHLIFRFSKSTEWGKCRGMKAWLNMEKCLNSEPICK